MTVFKGEGREGERLMVLITLKRKRVKEVYDYIKEKDINVFVSVNDITSYSGGVMHPRAVNPNNRV